MPTMRSPFAVSFALLVVLGAASPARAQWVSDLRREAFRLSDQGNPTEAIAALDGLIERRPRDVEAHIRRGNLLLRRNRPERAIDDFDVAIRYAPWSPSAYVARGIANVMIGDHDSAQRDFERSLQLQALIFNRDTAGITTARCGLGQIEHRRGRNERAIEEYGKAIGVNPSDPAGYTGRGEALEALGNHAQALSDFSEAIRLNPGASRAYTFRGEVLTQLGRYDQALTDFEAAIRLDPDDERAHSLRGSLLARLGRTEQAIDDFDAVIRIAPKRAAPYKDRGGLLVRLGRFRQAVDDLNEAARLDPTLASTYLNRGAAFNGLRQYERALEDLETAIRLDPKNAGAHSNAGLTLCALGHSDRALARLTEAVRLDPNNANVYLNRAEVYSQARLPEQALEDYDAVLRLDPRAAAAYVGRAKAHESLGHSELVIPDLDMAIRLNPTDATLFCTRGNAKRARSDWKGAIDDFTRAIQANPNGLDAYVYRGWSRLSIDVNDAEADARSYLNRQTHPDESSVYVAILGALGARRAGREAEARLFLDQALTAIPPRAWPAPVLLYLKREIPGYILLDSASDPAKKTEAHAFLGLDQLYSGDIPGALENLRWARDQGVNPSAPGDLARVTLLRVERVAVRQEH